MIGKLAIMQPYFFPYIGYFSLIKHTDEWIVFDTPQFIRHGWIERNRILKPSEGWQYIKVPLEKHPREATIRDIRIRTNEPWRNLIFAQLEHYKKSAPYYAPVISFLREAFEHQTDSIVSMDVRLLEAACRYIGIPFRAHVFSKMGLRLPEVTAPDEWSLNISLEVGAVEYINPPGGEGFFDRAKFERAGVHLTFLRANSRAYDQRRTVFEPGLSIIDVMMFNTRDQITEMLDDYTIS